MPLTLILESLVCAETEDWWGDEAELHVVCDDDVTSVLRRDMDEGDTWTLRRVYTFTESCAITLVDEDSPDSDDRLGGVTLRAADVGLHREATFTEDDADYTLTYSLLDLDRVPVDPLTADALTLWDATLAMRLSLYRDFHLVTEAIRGTGLEVSVAQVVGQIRSALAEFAAPSETFEDAYWTVVFEPVADCLGLVDEVTLAVALADTAGGVVGAFLRMVQGVEVMMAIDRVTGPGETDLTVLLADYCAAGDRSCRHGGPGEGHGGHDGEPTGGLAQLIAREQVAVAGLLERARGGEAIGRGDARAAVGPALQAIVDLIEDRGMPGTARRWSRSIEGRQGINDDTKAFVLPILELLAQVLEQERSRCTRLLASLEASFVGNVVTGEVHRPACAWVALIGAAHRVAFDSLTAAFAAGYDGCAHCLPEFHRR